MKKTFFLLAVLFSSVSLFAQPKYKPVIWKDVIKRFCQKATQQRPKKIDTLGYSVYYTQDFIVLTNVNPKAIYYCSNGNNRIFEHFHLFKNKQTAINSLFDKYYIFSPKYISETKPYIDFDTFFDKNKNVMAIEIHLSNSESKIPLKDIFKRYVNDDFNNFYNDLIFLFNGDITKEIDATSLRYRLNWAL